jgi:lysophospholipase L1-like esterase
MKQVFVYSDSLSWGLIPDTRKRLAFQERWPGVLEKRLNDLGEPARILEDCLNGRRTAWDDPFKPGRNGLVGLAQRIEMHSPLSLVILLLGTNDFQFSQPSTTAWSAAQGILALVNEIRRAPIEPGMPVPEILIVAPPPIRSPRSTMAPRFAGAEERSVGLADAYREMATTTRCHFYDAGAVTVVSPIDGVHLDADQHLILGESLASVVGPILQDAE